MTESPIIFDRLLQRRRRFRAAASPANFLLDHVAGRAEVDPDIEAAQHHAQAIGELAGDMIEQEIRRRCRGAETAPAL